MPSPKFWAYVQMLPALEARRTLQLIDAVSYAFGSMPQAAAGPFIQKLQARAVRAEEQLEQMTRPHRVASGAELAAALPGMHVVFEEGPQAKAAREAQAQAESDEPMPEETKADRMAAETDAAFEQLSDELDHLEGGEVNH